ncbi:BQ2448_2560 [Microbotryum intermedium]|uniref:Postreplication repair E3 ubiquitin-protein ligase RAD18 n=1 Tax=Microbotryum intermedium TaxID=269621 RepID=A0A238F6Q9_9BASI|nr:BQ2448_2560 [Microbotryum intermedium]
MVKRSTPAPAPPVPEPINFNIDDPTDFASPEIGFLDASLRCPICSELFVGPVILTTCYHTFCSRCLRQSLSERRKCPQCAMETDTSRLRKNQRIEEVVQAWQKARCVDLADHRRYQPPDIQSCSSHRSAILELQALATTAQRSSDEHPAPSTSKSQDSRPSKRFKSEGSGDAFTSTSSARNYSSSKRTSSTAYDDAASSDLEIIERPPVPSRRSKRSAGSSIATHGGNADDRKLNVASSLPANLNVECPICQVQVRNADMNRHIDSGCAAIKPAGIAWGSMFSNNVVSTSGESSKGKGKRMAKDQDIPNHPTTEPIAQVLYAGMKLKKIHALLEEFNLDLSTPPEATKQDAKVAYLTKRHQRWTTIWNANSDVDPKDPRHKTPAQMRQELKEWETTMSAQENRAIGNRNAYAMEHEKEFRELIKKGKEAQMAAKKKKEELAAAEQSKETKNDAMEVEGAEIGVVSATLGDKSASPSQSQSGPPPSSVVPDSPIMPPASMIKPRSSVRFAPASPSPSPSPALSVDPAEADSAIEESSPEQKSILPSHVLDLESHDSVPGRDWKRSPSPYDPRSPRPSQRNREEEEMWARRAAEEEEAEEEAELAGWDDYAQVGM